MTQATKNLWTLCFSILSFFIPFGFLISISTYFISRNSMRIETTSINKATNILSMISIIFSILATISAIFGFVAFFSN